MWALVQAGGEKHPRKCPGPRVNRRVEREGRVRCEKKGGAGAWRRKKDGDGWGGREKRCDVYPPTAEWVVYVVAHMVTLM